jgi:hypothetical protein
VLHCMLCCAAGSDEGSAELAKYLAVDSDDEGGAGDGGGGGGGRRRDDDEDDDNEAGRRDVETG